MKIQAIPLLYLHHIELSQPHYPSSQPHSHVGYTSKPTRCRTCSTRSTCVYRSITSFWIRSLEDLLSRWTSSSTCSGFSGKRVVMTPMRYVPLREAQSYLCLCQDRQLGIFRSDYLLHESEPGKPLELRQVEFNTIASSFGALSQRANELHRWVLALGSLLKTDISPLPLADTGESTLCCRICETMLHPKRFTEWPKL
jgi:hypothetical protein